MNKTSKKIAITTGDVNGIGAEITIKALNAMNLPRESVVLISNREVLNFYGKLKNDYELIEIPYAAKNILPGEITPESGEFGFLALEKACELAISGEIQAIVTAPLAKVAMHKAGHKFSGQTEVLQKFLAHDSQSAEMLFVAKDFRVLLLTRHVPLTEVSLNKDHVIEQITNLDCFFKFNLGILKPKFALCAFNPHAGEDGILGREEIEILRPAVAVLKLEGIDVTEPLPADTLFINAAKMYLNSSETYKPITPSPYKPYDCYIANYHDQGLIPIKTLAAEKTVNMTIGLDVVRTSPSHGTAFDIAGKNIASEASMVEAILQVLNV